MDNAIYDAFLFCSLLVEGRKGFMALMAIMFSNYIYSMWPKLLQHVKKSLYNQPKPYFFKKIL